MDATVKAYAALSDLGLWLKVNDSDQLTLSDLPALIGSRSDYIIDNWTQQIRAKIIDYANSYDNQARLLKEIYRFDDFVASAVTQAPSLRQNISSETLISRFYTIFDNIYISDIAISSTEQKIIEAEKKRVLAFTKSSFVDIRNRLVAGRDAISDTIGGTDSDYNKIYDRSPLPQLLSKSIDNITLSYQFQVGIFVVDAVLANETLLNSTASIDPFAFARANANNPEIDIRSYSSGRLVRLNYGESLQTLANRTMGDPDRWLEIAIANGLKPPYIDEVGEKITLVSNGKGNILNVPGKDSLGRYNKDKIYINQIVILQSNVNTQPDQRVIVSIKEIPISGELVLELNGEANLAQYKTQDQASLRIFQRHTINSNFYILIPSTEPAPLGLNKPEPWFLRSKSQDEKNAGVDLMLSDSGDLMLTPSGDIKLSYGVDNALQALKILISTEAGSLARHLNFGISNPIGSANYDPDQVRRSIAENLATQILNDRRFERLDNLTVEYISGKQSAASGYMVTLGVVLAGGGGTVIPISFNVNVPQ